MDPRQRYPEDQSRRTETDASDSRRDLRELETKLFQLERAFEMNLRSQSRRELEYNRVKLESEELRKLNDDATRARMEQNSRLMNAITERDHWKNAFLRQRESIKSIKIEHENAVALIRQECEGIARMTLESAEKQLHDAVDMQNESKEQVTRLEEQLEARRADERQRESRTLELANLLETLKRIDVNADSVCRFAADALKHLSGRGDLFEESARNLRRLAWTAKEREDEPRPDLLREQNSVLREVVKNLKRKLQAVREGIGEQRQTCSPREPPEGSIFASAADFPAEGSTIQLNRRDNGEPFAESPKKRVGNGAQAGDNRNSKCGDIERRVIDRRARLLCVETHSNGALFEEYVLELSFDREIKIKCPVSLNDREGTVRMEFVDDQDAYEMSSPDKMIVLFKNIHAAVHVRQTGIPCSTQTTRIRTSNSFTQTTLTGVNSFSRLNVGATMLNSEKRAIERSLWNLERTVRTLKLNALNQAETMIGRDPRLIGNDEMLDCVKALGRQRFA